MDSRLCISLYSIELKEYFCFVNAYGPYVERERSSNNLFEFECLKSSKLILDGDLNFSLGFSETWGARDWVDNLSDFLP